MNRSTKNLTRLLALAFDNPEMELRDHVSFETADHILSEPFMENRKQMQAVLHIGKNDESVDGVTAYKFPVKDKGIHIEDGRIFNNNFKETDIRNVAALRKAMKSMGYVFRELVKF